MTQSRKEKLQRFYERFSGEDQVLVAINADPDAIASAMAVKRLLWRHVAGVTISNVNVIERPDNLSMIRRLGVVMIPFDRIDVKKFTRFVLVDSQPGHHPCFKTFTPDVIIDHHPETGAVAPFVDIRPKYGATATILTEYLQAAKVKPSSQLASGLFYAIKTDTNNFTRQTVIEDIKAFQFIYPIANPNLIRNLEQEEIRFDFLKYFRIAFRRMKTRKGRMYAYLGPVVSPDVLVIIADFLLRVQLVNWTIVSGIHEAKLVIIFRNDGLRMDAGRVAQKGFGQVGSAGGHKCVARAEIPLSALKDHVEWQEEKKIAQWIINRIEKRAPVRKKGDPTPGDGKKSPKTLKETAQASP